MTASTIPGPPPAGCAPQTELQRAQADTLVERLEAVGLAGYGTACRLAKTPEERRRAYALAVREASTVHRHALHNAVMAARALAAAELALATEEKDDAAAEAAEGNERP